MFIDALIENLVSAKRGANARTQFSNMRYSDGNACKAYGYVLCLCTACGPAFSKLSTYQSKL